MSHPTPPAALAAELRRLTVLELSPSGKFVHVGLLLAALAMSTVVAALLLTEPDLPRRTSLAFVSLIAVGLCWAAFATWVLTRKRILFGRQRVVAARLAMAFSLVFTAGAAWIGYGGGEPAARAAAVMGLVMTTVAVAMSLRARRRMHDLMTQRAALERELAGGRT